MAEERQKTERSRDKRREVSVQRSGAPVANSEEAGASIMVEMDRF